MSRAQRIKSLINGLLEYAAAICSQSDKTASDCNIVLEAVIKDLQHAIDTSGARIRCERLPVVQVNQAHLFQIFSHLISNAVKYRSTRRPEICISAMEKWTNWIFSVGDNGIGLDMQYAQDIFLIFRRLPSPDLFDGNGIGLALCKAVIRHYGGEIWVESQLGRGSTFFFSFPK